MYVINAGQGFKMLWGTIKSFLDPKTASKIHVILSLYHIYSIHSVIGTLILIIFQCLHLKVLGTKYQNKLLEIIDERSETLIFSMHACVYWFPTLTFFLVSMCAVNCQNSLVANAGVTNTEVVKDQIKVLGRIPTQ
jgi:uncharacterized membrane protein